MSGHTSRRCKAPIVRAALAGGAEAMFLEVAADNPSARALYQANAFREVGRRPGYFSRRDGAVTALIMRRDLNR